MAEQADKARFPKDALFEVMTDTFGYDPQFVRGDLIRQSHADHYDFDWAERMGTLRLAPEYDGTNLASTTRPLNEDGSIDEVAQANARGEEPSYEALRAQAEAHRRGNTPPVAAGAHTVQSHGPADAGAVKGKA